MVGRLESNVAPVPICRRTHPSQALLAPVERFERRKPFLGKYILGICQNHDVNCTSFVLPRTQRHAEFKVTLRSCSRDANDDDSRVCTATRSDCSFLCIIIRQIARCVTQSNSSQRSGRPNAPRIRVFVLHSQLGIFRFGHISSTILSMARRTRRGTDFVGGESSTMQLKNPFRNVEKLCHLFSRLHFLSRRESKFRDLALRALSDFILCSPKIFLNYFSGPKKTNSNHVNK